MRRHLKDKQPLSFRNGCAMTILGGSIFFMVVGIILMIKNVDNLNDFNLQLFTYGINLILWGIGLAVAARLLYKEDDQDF